MTWDVHLTNYQQFPSWLNQLSDPTSDSRPSENANLNCGPLSVEALGYHLSSARVYADEIHDALMGESTGPTDATKLAKAFKDRFNAATRILTPTQKQNGKDGLLDFMWQQMYWGKGLLLLMFYGDPAQRIYHWRNGLQLTDSRAMVHEPWGGGTLTFTYDDLWAHFAGSDPSLGGGLLCVDRAYAQLANDPRMGPS